MSDFIKINSKNEPYIIKGLIQSRKAYAYLKPEAPILDEPFIHYGIPFDTEKYIFFRLK